MQTQSQGDAVGGPRSFPALGRHRHLIRCNETSRSAVDEPSFRKSLFTERESPKVSLSTAHKRISTLLSNDLPRHDLMVEGAEY